MNAEINFRKFLHSGLTRSVATQFKVQGATVNAPVSNYNQDKLVELV